MTSNKSYYFTLERFVESTVHSRDHWQLADDHLRHLCASNPTHRNHSEINAKLLIIGRSFAAGLERKVSSDRTQGSSLSQIARKVLSHGAEIDDLINALPSNDEHLSVPLIEQVLAAHGQLVNILSGITRNGQAARSFVSKYLHFHRPIVPLFDSFAYGFIPRFVRWDRSLEVVPYRDTFDGTYWEYLMRFWRILGDAREAGCNPTVREMDYYILFEADHAWTQNRQNRGPDL